MALRQVYDDNGTLKSKDIAGSGSANAADTVYDNSTTGLPANVQGALDKTTGNISSLGTVELTATAAHAHAAGSTFLWIGQLVKATAAIAVGDTIAVGTNVANTDICSVLDELSSNMDNIPLCYIFDTRTASQTPEDILIVNPNFLHYGHCTLVKFPFGIILSVCGTTLKSSGDWIAQLKSGFRPWPNFYFSYFLGNVIKIGYIELATGLIRFGDLNTDQITTSFYMPFA